MVFADGHYVYSLWRLRRRGFHVRRVSHDFTERLCVASRHVPLPDRFVVRQRQLDVDALPCGDLRRHGRSLFIVLQWPMQPRLLLPAWIDKRDSGCMPMLPSGVRRRRLLLADFYAEWHGDAVSD